MNTCATCKHWVPFERTPYYEPESPWSATELAEMQELSPLHAKTIIRAKRLGLCRKADGASPVDPTSLALAEDGSDYIANFRTAAEFGCVMHERAQAEGEETAP